MSGCWLHELYPWTKTIKVSKVEWYKSLIIDNYVCTWYDYYRYLYTFTNVTGIPPNYVYRYVYGMKFVRREYTFFAAYSLPTRVFDAKGFATD